VSPISFCSLIYAILTVKSDASSGGRHPKLHVSTSTPFSFSLINAVKHLLSGFAIHVLFTCRSLWHGSQKHNKEEAVKKR
jgi:hypothetical protein